jgi:hypothetical protein
MDYINRNSEIPIRILNNPRDIAGNFVQQLAVMACSPWATNCLCFVFLSKRREASGYENTLTDSSPAKRRDALH